MLEFTQTSFGDVGNCWQTSVACLLEVEPATLPDQTKCDLTGPNGRRLPPSYMNLLNGYLRKHHGLAYVELHTPGLLDIITVKEPGWHLLTGETTRSVEGSPRHVVVGRYGQMVHDPHPSRAGLSNDIKLAFLIPFPPEWEETWKAIPCECPGCTDEPDSLYPTEQ